jgi:hypothetical protein
MTTPSSEALFEALTCRPGLPDHVGPYADAESLPAVLPAAAAPPKLSRMLRGCTIAVNRQRVHVDRLDQQS